MMRIVLQNVNTPTDYIAAKPNDRRTSFTGSGLAFPTRDIAFDGTPNKGTAIPDSNGVVVISLIMPGSFYHNKTFFPPTLFIGNDVIPLAPPIPSRTLAVKKLNDFYSQFDRPIQSTEDVFRETAYPAFCYGKTIHKKG